LKTTLTALCIVVMSSALNAQDIGDVARAERKRQQEIDSSKVIQKIGDKKDAPVTGAIAAPEASDAAQSVDLQKIEKEMAQQRVDVMKQRSALLMKLNEVIHDRRAVEEIEKQLVELQNRSAELKLERIARLEEKKK
jgi:hypothetical protein